MKMILYSLKVCLYQIRIISKNYKIYTIPVCLFIFMKSFLDPFREFLIASGEKATPFLFPFFLNGKFCAAVVFAGILLFFVDAPFYDKDKLFVMIRCGRTKWITGQFFYIIFVSIGYMLCWVGISVLMLIPRIDFSNEWGRVWTTLALTDKAYELGLSFYVTPELVMNYQPVRAFFSCVWHGMSDLYFLWVMYVALKHLFRENYKFCGDHGFCITGYKSRVYAALDDLSCSKWMGRCWKSFGVYSSWTFNK